MYHIRCGIGRVDVLVVVFVVAMLVGVLLPALAKGRSESAAEVCESKLRRQWMGHLMWAEDDDGHFFRQPNGGPGWLWYRGMATYKDKKGYMTYDDIDCPASRQFGSASYSNPYGYWKSGGAFADPPYVIGGYEFNSIMGNLSSWPNGNNVASHKYPSQAAVVVDSWSVYWGIDADGGADSEISYRHKNKTEANVVWLDGHVSSRDPNTGFHPTDLYYNWPYQ